VLQEAELSGLADSENDLGCSSETMYYIGLDVHKKPSDWTSSRRGLGDCFGFAPQAALCSTGGHDGKQKRTVVVLEPDAAGIDIGAEEIYVAVPADRDVESTRKFSTFTRDLNALAEWLGRCRIRTVAMESTGVYWIPLFQILEERGFTVYLVNAHYLKSVPGRKSDVLDCQ
jgi:Transposase